MANQFKYIIVDDEELSRLHIEAEASKYPFLKKIASCSNAMEALELISQFQPDIVFADIEMPGVSGIDLIKTLSTGATLPIFVTSHPEYAIESYDLDAFDYLLKPVNADRFEKCARRLADYFELKLNAYAFNQEQDSSHQIIIKLGHDKYKIQLSDILYLEAMKDYTKIVTMAKQYLVLETLSGMHRRLPEGNFIRIHRSYVVNKQKIEIAKSQSVEIGGHKLPIGKLYKQIIAQAFS
jgi:DNA-binding LytR/AlgR family response regulator